MVLMLGLLNFLVLLFFEILFFGVRVLLVMVVLSERFCVSILRGLYFRVLFCVHVMWICLCRLLNLGFAI